MRGGFRTAALLNAQPPAALALIERAVAHDAEAYRHDSGELRIPMGCVVASALKA
jgi:hypothetical protein